MPGIQAQMSDEENNMARPDQEEGREEGDTESCLLCLEFLEFPRLLKCGHKFCSQCLVSYMEDYSNDIPAAKDTYFQCPTCLQTSAPDENFPQGATEDTRVRPDSKTYNTSQPCDVCNFISKPAETEVHCSRCVLNLCSDCKDVHNNHELFRLHSVVHIANKFLLAIYCDDHNNMQSHYFCDDCQKPCCAVCVLQDHSAHNTCTIVDTLSQRRDKIKSQLNIIAPELNKIESKIKTLTEIGERRSKTPFSRSASEPAKELNRSMDSQSDTYSKNEFDLYESEASHLLPNAHVSFENEKAPMKTTKRKRLSVDHERFSRRNSQSASGNRRKLSFLDNLRGKKMSEPQVDSELVAIIQTPKACNTDVKKSPNLSRTPSPYFQRKVSRQPSTGSRKSQSAAATSPWHQFTRMGKTSPILQRRKLASTVSHPETGSIRKEAAAPAPDTHLLVWDTQMTVDTDKIGKYKHNLQLIRKLCSHAGKTVSTRRFLGICDELEQRLISATTVEVAQLKARVNKMVDKHQAALQAMTMTPSSSFNSVDVIGAFPRRKTSPSGSEDMKGDSNIGDKQLSLLVTPHLLWKTEKHKSDPGDLWNRCGIAFLPNGNIVVAEYDMNNVKNNRLHIYCKEGKTVRVICEEQMRPLGVAVTAEGHIAVTDCKSKRVKIVTEFGHPVSEWGKGHFGWPHGIAVNSKGQFVVTDAFNDFVSVHHPDGKKIRQFGASGSATTCFKNPFHVAIDHSDNIIISDCGNNCIKVFNPEGQFLFSNRGVSSTSLEGFASNKNRRLKSPRGVIVDPKGNILVADDSSRVVMFDSRGKYIRNVLTEEEHVKLSGEEHVKFVEGMAISKEGTLALTECNPSQMFAVKVFSLYEFS